MATNISSFSSILCSRVAIFSSTSSSIPGIAARTYANAAPPVRPCRGVGAAPTRLLGGTVAAPGPASVSLSRRASWSYICTRHRPARLLSAQFRDLGSSIHPFPSILLYVSILGR